MEHLILSSDRLLDEGLRFVGFDSQYSKCSKNFLISRFVDHYGSNPEVCSKIWEDIVNSDLPECQIDNNGKRVKEFLLFLHFLRAYPKEANIATMFRTTEKTCRKWIWYFSKKVQALKRKKVC
jgi:hypothetical protein